MHKTIIMDATIKEYNVHNLQTGAKYSICPLCSHERKKSSQKCALLDWKTGIGTCMHCGEVFQLHTFEKGRDNFMKKPLHKRLKSEKPKQIPISTIPQRLLDATLKQYDSNNFYKVIVDVFGEKKAIDLMLMYKVGTSNHWDGANIFWQVDVSGNVRTGKIMLYDVSTKKRVKEPKGRMSWVHTVLKLSNFNCKQCLFGEHLTRCYKPIALVESEKTAIIANGYLSNFTWVATGGMMNFTAERLKNLQGKTITVFPDLDGIANWKKKAIEISQKVNINFVFDSYLEKTAIPEDYSQKLDLADYLLRFNYEEDLSAQERIFRSFQRVNPMLSSFIQTFGLAIDEYS